MKTQNKMLIILSFCCLFVSCNNNNDINNELNEKGIACCENKKTLKTFKGERGIIKCRTDPSVDRLFYYFFEPLSSYREFSNLLLVEVKGGIQGESNLDKYINKIVLIDGNITNCLYQIREFPCGDCPSTMVDYNILELVSVKTNN